MSVKQKQAIQTSLNTAWNSSLVLGAILTPAVIMTLA
jgi:hypothetical protein